MLHQSCFFFLYFFNLLFSPFFSQGPFSQSSIQKLRILGARYHLIFNANFFFSPPFLFLSRSKVLWQEKKKSKLSVSFAGSQLLTPAKVTLERTSDFLILNRPLHKLKIQFPHRRRIKSWTIGPKLAAVKKMTLIALNSGARWKKRFVASAKTAAPISVKSFRIKYDIYVAWESVSDLKCAFLSSKINKWVW